MEIYVVLSSSYNILHGKVRVDGIVVNIKKHLIFEKSQREERQERHSGNEI